MIQIKWFFLQDKSGPKRSPQSRTNLNWSASFRICMDQVETITSM